MMKKRKIEMKIVAKEIMKYLMEQLQKLTTEMG